jgi:hypothetical protein
MTTQTIPPDQETVTHPPQSRPKSNWSARFRWFAAEFMVVLVGVLVALAVNDWKASLVR